MNTKLKGISSRSVALRAGELAQYFKHAATCLLVWAVAGISLAQAQEVAVTSRHAPSIQGRVEGSVWMLLGEGLNLNSGATLTGDLLVPGTPQVIANGTPTWSGVAPGTGSAAPTGYSLYLNSGATLRYVRTQTDAATLPTVGGVPSPSGTRSVTVNSSAQSVGSWATLRNLTLNSNVGTYTPPAGAYGSFTVNSGSALALGTVGATTAAEYSFQSLTLNSGGAVQILGPVILHLGSGVNLNSVLGSASRPDWLTVRVTSGAVNVNSGGGIFGTLVAPASQVSVNGQAAVHGAVFSDRFTVNSGGLVRWVSTALPPSNQSPVAYPQQTSTAEDIPLDGTLSATDPDGNPLAYVLGTPPQHGTLNGAFPAFIYTPSPNFSGTDSFTFHVSDGTASSAPATVSITVTPVNDAPTATPLSFSTLEDTPYSGTLAGADADGDALAYNLATPPQHGTLSGVFPAFTYTPGANYAGIDSFTFTTTDGTASSAPATVSITVTPVNDAPTAAPLSFSTLEDTPYSGTLAGADADGNALVYSVATPPQHGTLAGTFPAFTYTPDANYVGVDSFTYIATDGTASSTPATVSITVAPVNDAPIAAPLSFSTPEDEPLHILLTGADEDDDNLTFVIEGDVPGTLQPGARPGEYLFTPSANFHGQIALHYRARDGLLSSPPAPLAITVTPVNDAPLVFAGLDQTISLPVFGGLLGAVSDVETASANLEVNWAKVTGPGEVVFRPATASITEAAFTTSGTYVLRLTAADGDSSTSDEVMVTVLPGNAAPLAQAGEDQVLQGALSTTLSAQVTDDGLPTPEALRAAWTKVSGPGSVAFAAARSLQTGVVFSEYGDYVLRLTATDGDLATNDTIRVVARAANQSPLVNAGADVELAWQEEGVLQGTVSDDHLPAGTSLSLRWEQQSGPGTALIADPIQARTTTRFSVPGVYRLRLTAEDGELTSLDEVSVTVRPPVNQPPQLKLHGPITLSGSNVLQLTAQVSDDGLPAGGSISFHWQQVSGPSAANFAAPTVRESSVHLPQPGAYTLSLTASDGELSTTAQLSVTVLGNASPQVSAGPDQFIDLLRSAQLSGRVLDDGLPTATSVSAQWELVSGPGTAVFQSAEQPSTKVTVSADGEYTFRLRASDSLLTAEDMVVVVFENLNTAPQVDAGPDKTIAFDRARSENLLVNGSGELPMQNGNIVGWEEVSGTTWASVQGGVGAYPAAAAGSSFFVPGTAAAAELAQTVSVAPFSQTVDEGSQLFQFSMELRSKNELKLDHHRVVLEYRSAAQAIIAKREFDLSDAASTWVIFTDAQLAPAGTRFIRVRLLAENSLVDAGNDAWFDNVSLHALSIGIATLTGTVTDDGLPEGSSLVTTWRQVSGPAQAVIAQPASPLTPVYALVPGEYEFALSADDNRAVAEDRVRVNVTSTLGNQPPSVQAGEDLLVGVPGESAPLNGTVSDPETPAAQLRTAWSKVSGEGEVVFTQATSAQTAVRFSAAGSYVLRLSVSDGELVAFDEINVTVDCPTAPWPLDLSIVIDNSSSMEGAKLADAKSAAITLAQRLDPLWDTANLVIFSQTARVLRPQTHLFANVVQSIQGIVTDSATSVHEGLRLAREELLARGRGGNATPIIVLITDGGSDVNLAVSQANAAKAAGMRIITVGVGTDSAHSLLQTIATTAADYYFVPDSSKLTELYERLAASFCRYAPDRTISAHAGPDLQVDGPSESASLQGRVDFTNIPPEMAQSIRWEQTAGPGPVAFGDSTLPVTTATFPSPGLYTLTLVGKATHALQTLESRDSVTIRADALCQAPSKEAVAWWTANDISRDEISGLDPTGTITYTGGKVGSAFSFNGGTNVVRAAASPELDLGASSVGFTVETWVLFPSETLPRWVASWADGSALGTYIVADNGLRFRLRDAQGTQRELAIPRPPANQWHHIAYCYHRSTGVLQVYLNGVLAGQRTDVPMRAMTSGSFALGQGPSTMAYPYAGALDETTLYARPLSAMEVQAIFEAGAVGKCPAGDNQPPVVNAGEDFGVSALPWSVQLSGDAMDDGLPTSSVMRTEWTKQSGPGNVTFAQPNSLETRASFSAPGIYTLQLRADDGVAQTSDVVIVRVGQPCSIGAPKSLVGWWPLNGDFREAISQQAPVHVSLGFLPGKVAQATGFNGSSAYLLASREKFPQLDLGASAAGFTVEAWFQLFDDPYSINRTLFGWANGPRLYYNGGGLAFATLDGQGTERIIYTARPASNQWHHVAFCYHRGSGHQQLYLNGILVSHRTDTPARQATNADFSMGAALNASSYPYNGWLDEVSLYNVPLNGQDIQAIYQAGAVGKCPALPNQPPAVSAGELLSLDGPGTVELQGDAVDDGLPRGSTLGVEWSKVSGPGEVTFSSPRTVNCAATFSVEGIYTLRLTADDGLSQAEDVVEVRVGSCAVQPPPGLVGWWPLNGSFAEAISGRVPVHVSTGFSPGKVSQGVGFNASSSYIHAHRENFPNLDAGSSAAGMSVETWIYLPTDTAGRWIFGWENGARLSSDSSSLHFYMPDGQLATTRILSVAKPAAGHWHHFAFCYNRATGQQQIYLNGILRASRMDAPMRPVTDRHFFVGIGSADSPFNGSLDELSIYNRPLSAAEITGIYEAGALGKCPAPRNDPPKVQAGNDQLSVLGGRGVLYGATVDDGLPISGVLTTEWVQLSGPAAATIAAPASPQSSVTLPVAGTYTFRLTAHDGLLSSSDEVALTMVPEVINQAPAVQVPADSVLEPGQNLTLTGAAADDGIPNAALLLTWSKQSGPGAVTFGAPTALETSVSFSAPGTYVLRLQAWDGALSGSDSLTINVLAEPANLAPTLSLGADRAHPFGPLVLPVAIADDGRPGTALTVRRSQLSGPGLLSLTDLPDDVIRLQFPRIGTYRLHYEVSDGELATTDEVEITVTAEGASAPEAQLTAPSAGAQFPLAQPVWLQASAVSVDDASIEFVEFLVDDVVVGSTIAAPYTVPWQPVAAGAHSLAVRVRDSRGISAVSAPVVVHAVAPAPRLTLLAPVAQSAYAPGSSVALAVNAAPASGGAPVAQVEYLVDGSVVAISTSAPFSAQWLAPAAVGEVLLSARATDTAGLSATAAAIPVRVVEDPSTPLEAALENLLSQTITAPTSLIGTVSGAALVDWRVEVRRVDEACNDWTTVAAGIDPITSGELGTLDPTLLVNGLYELRLTARDAFGRTVGTGTEISVEGGMKVGHFTVAFADLQIPLAGIPLTVTRVYDSRERCPGDFGYGWKLDLEALRVEKNVALGQGWETLVTVGDLTKPSTYQLLDAAPHLLSVRMPDGEVLRFTPKLVVNRAGPTLASMLDADGDDVGQVWAPIGYRQTVRLLYRARGGTKGATLRARGYRATGVWGGGNSTVAADAPLHLSDPGYGSIYLTTSENSAQDAPMVVDATGWELTTKDGRVFLFDAVGRLESMRAPQGQLLTIHRNAEGTPQRVTHSTGGEVVFHRNAEGFITRITDPAGRECHYGYDAAGQLRTYWNAAADLTGAGTQSFTYTEGTHFLQDLYDGEGHRAAKNYYDDAGRLQRTVDAQGKETVFTHEVGSRTETIRDRAGHSTFHRYDEHGNIVESITPDQTRTVTAYYTWPDGRKSDLKTSDSISGLFTQPDGTLSQATYTTSYAYEDDDPATPPANDGLLRKLVDPLGHTTRLTYDDRGNVLTVRDALNHVTTNTYHPGTTLLATTTDAAGHLTSFTYDGGGQVDKETRTVTTPDGVQTLVTDYDYDARGYLTRLQNAAGHVTHYVNDARGNRLQELTTRTVEGVPVTELTEHEYDLSDRLLRTWDAAHPRSAGHLPASETAYDANGRPEYTWDALRRMTKMEYHPRGELFRTTFADGTTELTHYDAEGRREFSTDRRGKVTQTVYDAQGRTTGQVFLGSGADAPVSLGTTTYDAAGRVYQSTDAENRTTTQIYDAAGRRVGVKNALGQISRYTYDDAGRQLTFTDALQRTTTYGYDALGRRTSTLLADGSSTSTGYDEVGRRVRETDANGFHRFFAYDALGRLTTVTDHLGHITRYGYDEVGNQISQTDALQHTTTYRYDALGRRVRRTLPLGQVERVEYDRAGNPTERTDFNGTVTSYTYDLLNRLLTRSSNHAQAAASAVTFTYTASGQRHTMADASGLTTYGYDSRDRLESKETPQGTLSYTYHADNQLATLATNTPGGTSLTYGYDALGRLDTVTDGHLGVTEYSYDDVGNLEGVSAPNGTAHAYAYNSVNRLTDVAIWRQPAQSTGTMLAHAHYTLAAGGQRTGVEETGGFSPAAPAGTRVTVYAYDELLRLTGETISGHPGRNGSIGYTLDAVGNRLTRTSTVAGVASQTFTYDANDRIEGEGHDANGNTLTSTQRLDATGAETLHLPTADQYDSENRLIARTAPQSVQIVYDGDGHKVREVVNGYTISYLVDEQNPTGYAQVVEEKQNGVVLRTYTYGHDLLAQDERDGGGSWSATYFGYDGHGNVRLLTDATGQITDTYVYDAFGIALETTGSTFNRYRYSGEAYDGALGLQYLRARLMNSSSGRFWTMDSYEGRSTEPASLHKYSYAGNDPIMYVDPTGHFQAYAQLSVGMIVSNIARATMMALPRLVLVGSTVVLGMSLGKDALTEDRKAVREEVNAAVAESRFEGRVLFHYTNLLSAIDIVASQYMAVMRKPAKSPVTGIWHPVAAYATDIAPWEKITQTMLANLLYWSQSYAEYRKERGDLDYCVVLVDEEPYRWRHLDGREYIRYSPLVRALTYVRNPMPRQ